MAQNWSAEYFNKYMEGGINPYSTTTATGTTLTMADCERYYKHFSELLNKKPMNIKIIAKKMLSKDLRTLVKAGILDDDLTINNSEFIQQFIVNKFLKELAVEAQELIDERKSEKDE